MKKKFQSELFKKYIRINFLVIFLPLVIVTTVYWIVIQNNYTKQYLDAMKYTSTEDMRELEEMMRAFKATAMQISLDTEMSPYHLKSSNYDAIRAIDKLGYYSKGMQYMDELVIYLNDSGKLYTTAGVVDIDIFLDKVYRAGKDYTASDLRKLIESKEVFGTTLESETVTKSRASSIQYRVVTYPLKKTGSDAYGALIGFYPDKMDEHFLDNASGIKNEHIILLCSGSLDLIYSRLPQKLLYMKQDDTLKEALGELLKDWSSGQDNCEMRLGKQTCIGKIVRSEVNGWYLIDLVNKRSITQNIILLQLPMMVLTIVCLLLTTIMLSVVLSVYHYLPIQRLYSLFDKKQEKKKKNELLYLNSYIRELMEEQSNIEEQLEATRHIGRMEMVKRLLRGNLDITNEQMQKQLSSLEIYVEGSCLTAIVVRVTSERPKGYVDRLGRILLGLERRDFYLTDMIYRDYFAFLACPEGEEELLAFAEEILDSVGEGVEFVHIGIGNSYRSADSLKFSLMEAIISVEGSQQAVNRYSGSLTDRNEELYWKPLPGEGKLRQALLQGMDRDVSVVIDELHKELLYVAQSHSDEILQFVMHRIFTDLFEVSLCVRESGGEQFLHYSNVDEFCSQLQSFSEMEIRAQLAKKEARSEERMQNIIQYINDNYEKQEMSLALVAEKFDMTSSYLSRIFKNCMGENFIDYLTNKRLEKAAFLLEETDCSIGRIVEMVGYSDATSFTRKFTRHYNMSPGNYRKVKREK